MDTWDENLVILCWLYVKNCIFEHIIDNFFPMTDPSSETLALLPRSPKVEVLEPLLHGGLVSDGYFVFYRVLALQ